MNTEIAAFRKSVEVLQEKVDRYKWLFELDLSFYRLQNVNYQNEIELDEESALAWDSLLESDDLVLREYAKEHAADLIDKIRLSRKVRLLDYFSEPMPNHFDPKRSLDPYIAVDLSHLNFNGLGGAHRVMLDIVSRVGRFCDTSCIDLCRAGMIILTGHSVPEVSHHISREAEAVEEALMMTTVSFGKSGEYDYEGPYKVGVFLSEWLGNVWAGDFDSKMPINDHELYGQVGAIAPLWCWIDTSGWIGMGDKERLLAAHNFCCSIWDWMTWSPRHYAPTFIIT